MRAPAASRVRSAAIASLLCNLVVPASGCTQDEPEPVVRPNFVLIAVDTLRADRLGYAGHAGAHGAPLDPLLRLGPDGRSAPGRAAGFEDAVGRAAGLGFPAVMAHWPRRDGIYAGSESVLDEVASRLPGLR